MSRAIHPKLLLKVILFGYSRWIISSRQIERACGENILFLALSGGCHPDHSTLAHFVSSMQKEIESLFANILLVCEELYLLGGTHFSLDRVKLQAKLQQVIEEHSHQDGLSSAETERQQQEKRLLHKVERLNEFLQEEQPKIGKSGKEIQSNVTDNGPARTPTSHGVIQGQQIYARRLAIVEPVFANLRVQKRLDHFTVRSKAKVDVQWNFSPWPITLVKSTGMSRFYERP